MKIKTQNLSSNIIANLLRDNQELVNEVNRKDNIIEELKNKLSFYERRLSCQK